MNPVLQPMTRGWKLEEPEYVVNRTFFFYSFFPLFYFFAMISMACRYAQRLYRTNKPGIRPMCLPDALDDKPVSQKDRNSNTD